jgi:transcription elongation factor Elf1
VPASGEGLPRGTRIDAASLERSNLTEQTFRCPHCGHEHTWSAKDAWVEYVC